MNVKLKNVQQTKILNVKKQKKNAILNLHTSVIVNFKRNSLLINTNRGNSPLDFFKIKHRF